MKYLDAFTVLFCVVLIVVLHMDWLALNNPADAVMQAYCSMKGTVLSALCVTGSLLFVLKIKPCSKKED